MTITLGSPISFLLADGVLCKLPFSPAVLIQSSGYSSGWPLATEAGQPFECTKGPPSNLRFEFTSEFGPLVAQFVWNGVDVTIDIEVPSAAVTPAPSAPALPRTGGAANSTPSPADNWLAATAIPAILGLVSAIFLKYRLRRRI